MTPEQIEAMAHSVGMLPARGNVLTCGNRDGVTLDALTRFATLVRAQALEDAAKHAASLWMIDGQRSADEFAAAIRALP